MIVITKVEHQTCKEDFCTLSKYLHDFDSRNFSGFSHDDLTVDQECIKGIRIASPITGKDFVIGFSKEVGTELGLTYEAFDNLVKANARADRALSATNVELRVARKRVIELNEINEQLKRDKKELGLKNYLNHNINPCT